LTTKKEIIAASKVYFNERFGQNEFVPGETYIPPSGKVLDAEDCANLIDASLRYVAHSWPFRRPI
jgi:CDP-6-deoxy-D-xylo-4-hexulose-3-dehydrase